MFEVLFNEQNVNIWYKSPKYLIYNFILNLADIKLFKV